VNEAKGEAQKFSLLLAEYRKAPEVTRRRLYLEAMQAILPSLQRKIIVDDSLKNVLQTLPLLPSNRRKRDREYHRCLRSCCARFARSSFSQSGIMSILGVLFLLTAFKWGTLLFIVHQYETSSSHVSAKLFAPLRHRD